MRGRLAAMQVDETRACQTRGEVVAVRANSFQETAPALALVGGELLDTICPVMGVGLLAVDIHGGILCLGLGYISRPCAGLSVMR